MAGSKGLNDVNSLMRGCSHLPVCVCVCVYVCVCVCECVSLSLPINLSCSLFLSSHVSLYTAGSSSQTSSLPHGQQDQAALDPHWANSVWRNILTLCSYINSRRNFDYHYLDHLPTPWTNCCIQGVVRNLLILGHLWQYYLEREGIYTAYLIINCNTFNWRSGVSPKDRMLANKTLPPKESYPNSKFTLLVKWRCLHSK